MGRVTLDQLADYLEKYGWCYEKLSSQCLQSGWNGDERDYPLRIDFNETSVSFQIEPFIHMDIEWLQWPELSLFLLELNAESQMVKVAVNEKGDIILASQCLSEGFTYEAFSMVLGVIGFYADAFYDEIISCLEICGYQNHSRGALLI